MVTDRSFPAYLLPLEAVKNAQVVREIREKTDANGAHKTANWNGLPGWVVPVEIVRGTREKVMPGGQTLTVLDSAEMSITVWSRQKPAVAVGDYVSFDGLAFGAVEGAIYAQALGCSRHDEKLDLLFGGGDGDEQ